jgi:hypothetical protein
MVCKHCGSKHQQIFNAELTATYLGIENLSSPPVYLCKDILICTDCGNIELKLSGAELEQLKDGLAVARGRNHSGNDSSLRSQ